MLAVVAAPRTKLNVVPGGNTTCWPVATAATLEETFARRPNAPTAELTALPATFCAAGSAGGAVLVLFDDESDVTSVWPYEGRLDDSNEIDAFLDDQCNVDVDAYCAARIASTHGQYGPDPTV